MLSQIQTMMDLRCMRRGQTLSLTTCEDILCDDSEFQYYVIVRLITMQLG